MTSSPARQPVYDTQVVSPPLTGCAAGVVLVPQPLLLAMRAYDGAWSRYGTRLFAVSRLTDRRYSERSAISVSSSRVRVMGLAFMLLAAPALSISAGTSARDKP